ncbi:MAG: hypothetical protein K0S45_2611 [Nitrospira sp.]|nr:hypothetical protein [Nitrospira sp.]
MFQVGPGFPSEAVQARDVKKLSRRSVWFTWIKYKSPFEPHSFCYGMSKFGDGQIRSHPNIDEISSLPHTCFFHQEYTRIGQIVAIEELPARAPASPHHHLPVTAFFGLMRLTDQCWNDM